MNTMIRKSLVFLSFLFLVSIGSAASPLTQDVREVATASEDGKTITLSEGMVWYAGRPRTHGIRFPEGTYRLESEDDSYLYFRSDTPLEMRIFKNGSAVDGREIPGGIMLNKKKFSRVPAAGYIDNDESSKMMIWKLGRSFLSKEGKVWRKNFK